MVAAPHVPCVHATSLLARPRGLTASWVAAPKTPRRVQIPTSLKNLDLGIGGCSQEIDIAFELTSSTSPLLKLSTLHALTFPRVAYTRLPKPIVGRASVDNVSLCIGHILPKLISLKSGSDGWRRPGVSALSRWLFTYMIVCARLFEPPFPVTQPIHHCMPQLACGTCGKASSDCAARSFVITVRHD